MGEGQAHAQERASSTATTSSRSAAGRSAPSAGSSTSIASTPAATTRAATTSGRPAIRSRRSCSARFTSANQTIPVEPTFDEAYTAAWVNDEFKVSDKLTLTLGLRFDYQSARTESNDQYSTFDPNTPNPGAGGHPRRAHLRRRRGRAGGHADIRESDEATRGGRVSASPTASTTRTRFAAATASTTPASPSTSSSASRHSASRRTCSRRTRRTALHRRSISTTASRQNRIVQPPFIDPTIDQRWFADRGGDERADAAALPELVRHLPAAADQQHDAGRLVHREPRQPSESPLSNAGRGREHERSRACWHSGRRCCSRTSTPTWRATRASSRRIRASTATSHRRCDEWPQYQGIQWRGVPTGESQYHAIELVLERRFSRGLQARFGYTYSRLSNNGAESAQGNNGDQRSHSESRRIPSNGG